ncbi:hypothetical protein V8B97DRAFT_1956791 [Scleroderma yunnanense]
MPPCVHNAESISRKSNLTSNCKQLSHDLYLEKDGWIVGAKSQVLLWVPPSYWHSYYLCPPCRLVIGGKHLISFWTMAHGSTWHQCYCLFTDST